MDELINQFIKLREAPLPWLPYAPQPFAQAVQAAQGTHSPYGPQLPQGDTPIDLHGIHSPIRPKPAMMQAVTFGQAPSAVSQAATYGQPNSPLPQAVVNGSTQDPQQFFQFARAFGRQ